MGRTTTKLTAENVNQTTGETIPATVGVHQECVYKASGVLTTDSITICASPCILYGIYVNVALSAHVVTIDDGSTVVLSLPVSQAIGTMWTFPGIRFETSLICNPDNAMTTGDITFAYKVI